MLRRFSNRGIIETLGCQCRDMKRVIALHARTCERLAVLLDFYRPFRIPVPDVYKHLIFGVLRIGISIFLEIRF